MLRRIEGLEGTVQFSLTIQPRPDDGRTIPRFQARGRAGYCADFGGRMLFVAVNAPMDIAPGKLSGTATVRKGDRITLWMVYAEEAPAVYPHLSTAEKAIDDTVSYWTGWTDQCRYSGPSREQVLRSAITLKLLTYAPSGAIVAAPYFFAGALRR